LIDLIAPFPSNSRRRYRRRPNRISAAW